MKKRVNIITAVVLMALTGLVTYVVTFSWVQDDFNQKLETFSTQRQEWGPFYMALNNIGDYYVGEPDRQKMMQGAIDGMVRNLGDRWSHYFDPESFRAYLESQDDYIGIGVSVAIDSLPLLIYEVMPHSPARDVNLLEGDLITHIDGASVVALGYDASVERLKKGDEYTTVSLTIERPSEGGGSFTVDVMRRTIVRERVAAELLDSGGGKVGLVKISSFEDRVDEEFIEKVGALLEEGAAGLVFDVRNNPGGKLQVLERMLDYLLPEGELITLKYKDGRVDVRASGPECIELPMAVVINGDSVSAAEFFAACLQEYDWAVVVGEKTGGKGYAQEHFRLSDGSGLYLSTSEYFTSKGVSLAGVGLTPDVEIVLSEDERRHIGDPSLDRQLQRALLELNYRG